MDFGMMWADDRKVPLDVKLLAAAQYYQIKYGHKPSCVVLNDQDLSSELARTGGGLQLPMGYETLQVKSLRVVLPGNIWIGEEQENGSK